jgi:DNA helicase HerA-like ATPase
MCIPSGIFLGRTGFLSWQWYFLSEEERKAHMYIVGTTTKGKSKLMANCLTQDILAGRGAGVIDPHGDLADDLIRCLASHRKYLGLGRRFTEDPKNLDRIVYIDPARTDYCVGINPLQTYENTDLYEAATGIIEVFRRIWPVSLNEAPVFFDLMLNTLIALMENRLTLLETPRLLTDKPYRDELLSRVNKHTSVLEFFHSRYDRWGREQSLKIESTLNKVSALVTSERLRNILGQKESTIDFRDILDKQKVLVVNLGDCGETTGNFLGSIILARLQQAAASRRDIPERDNRKPYHLYVDEFHSFVAQEGGSKTFSQMLSTSAKFGLHLVLAHQTQSQLDFKTKGAIGNIGVKVVFGVDREDAEVMAKKLFAPDLTQVKSEAHTETQHPIFTPVSEQWEKYTQELQGLPSRYAYARSGNGEAKRLHTDTVDGRGCPAEELERVKLCSLKKYGRPVGEVARELTQRHTTTEKSSWVQRYEPAD